MLRTARNFMLFAAVMAGSTVPAAFADDTGLATSLHDVRRERGRLCLSDHWHYGNGSGPTKKAAEADAIASWQGFTAMEYGTDWGRFTRAASRKVSCSGGGGNVNCSIEARPCR